MIRVLARDWHQNGIQALCQTTKHSTIPDAYSERVSINASLTFDGRKRAWLFTWGQAPGTSLTSAVRTELYIQECRPAHSTFPTTRMLLCSGCTVWRLDNGQREARKTMSKRAFSIGLQHGANQRTESERQNPQRPVSETKQYWRLTHNVFIKTDNPNMKLIIKAYSLVKHYCCTQ